MTSVKGSLTCAGETTAASSTGTSAGSLTTICVPSVVTAHPTSRMPSPHSSLTRTTSHQSSIAPLHLPPPPPPPFPRVPASRLPIIAHPHPVMLFEGPPGALIPLPLPPPPYSTLPSRCNQRRFFDQLINFNANFLHPQTNSGSNFNININSNSQGNCGSGSANTNASSSSPSTAAFNVGSGNNNNNNNNINSNSTPSCLPSYHHLYSSVSPASLRRQQRRIRREQRAASDPEASSLTENKKYMIFVSLLVVGICLMFAGIVTLSLFTISFGFTFILFALVLYKFLPSSKYAPRIVDPRRSPMTLTASTVRGHHAYMISPTAECVVTGFPLPPPPPSYQEALTSGQIIQPLDASNLISSNNCNSNSNSNSYNNQTNNSHASDNDARHNLANHGNNGNNSHGNAVTSSSVVNSGNSLPLSQTSISNHANNQFSSHSPSTRLSHQRNLINTSNLDTTGFHGFNPAEVTVVTARTDSVTVTSTCSPAKSAAVVKVESNDHHHHHQHIQHIPANRVDIHSGTHVPIMNSGNSLTTTSSTVNNNQSLSTVTIASPSGETTNNINNNNNNNINNNNNSQVVITDGTRNSPEEMANSNNRLHFITIIEATI